MPFFGVGATPNSVSVNGTKAHNLWTFWLEGCAAGGSILVLVGSADNSLAVDPRAFPALEQLRPGFDYPSSTDGLTALIQATSPNVQATIPDEEWGWMRLRDVDVVAFALDAPRRCDEESVDIDLEENELPEWERRRGRVRGLARVYACASAADLKASHDRFDWLPDGTQVAVAAPYALAVV
jgi:hypothetical protein